MLAKGACASAICDQGSRVVRHGVAGQGKGSDVGDADSGKRSTEPDTSTAASSVPNVSLSRGHLLHPRRWRYCDAIHGEGVEVVGNIFGPVQDDYLLLEDSSGD